MRNLFILFCCFSISSLFAQSSTSFWQTTNEALIGAAPDSRVIVPEKYEALQLDLEAVKVYLKNAPKEFSEEAKQADFLMDFPLPDGQLVSFVVYSSPVMMDGLAAKYPQIKSYGGYSTNRDMKLRFSVSPSGLNAAITSILDRETFYVDPYSNDQNEFYISYNVRDHQSEASLNPTKTCGFDQLPDSLRTPSTTTESANSRGAGAAVDLRIFRLALGCTGNWGNANGGNITSVMAEFNNATNRLNQIFELDVSFRLMLVDDTDELVYFDAATDPYPVTNSGGAMIGINTTVFNSTIGQGSYDIGHLFNTSCDVGGVASLGAVCGSNKASAVTCYANISGSNIETTAHEMGHSFSANHTWNRCSLTNTDNLSAGTAYEPGSGYTIMSYYGVCNPSQNVASAGPTDYFHINSIENIYDFTNGLACADNTPSENHYPEIVLDYTNGFYIPIGTPFELDADGTDEDGDILTYCWEQYNLSPLHTFLGSPEGNEPSFRSFPPTPNSLRVFPRMQNIVTNINIPGEVLPAYTRNLTFRCSVRDNNPIIGGTTWAEMSFEATDEAGPFRVNVPNFNNVTWTVGEDVDIEWDVANTNGAVVNCQNVNILLSVDGGYTYPFTLAEGVPNNGSHVVVVPQAVSSIARVRVEAADNIFFDISNGNFVIEEATVAGFNFDAGPYEQQVCSPENPVIDFSLLSILSFNDPVTFNVTGLPTGAVANFTNNPASPVDGTELTIDMTNADASSNYFEVTIEGMVEGVDTHTRLVYLDVVSNDHTALALSGPSYGQISVVETPTFEWSNSANAITYEFQLATNPSFDPATIIDEQLGLVGPPFNSDVVLDRSTPYYWRVRPINTCGPGAYTTTFAFHTEVLACSSYSYNITTIISSQGTPSIEAPIEVNQAGNVSDVNVTKIKGQHDLIKHIAVSLISPSNTEVELFSEVCPGSNSSTFNLGIDDNSPLSISCPPISGAPMMPETPGALATFNGESAQGLWTLRLDVVDGDGNGGALDSWALQLCSTASANAPFLVNNETLLVPPGAFNYVLIDQLFSDDTDNSPSELTYTLLERPEEGNLLYNGNIVEIGATFKQITINAGNLTYEHTPGAGLTDQFIFTVSDGNGGWIPPTVFQIEMDEDAVVGTADLASNNDLLVFPNPTKDLLNVKLTTPVNAAVEVRLYNVQGKLMAIQSGKSGMDLIQFDTDKLSAGLYFVELNIGGQSLVEKVAVYK
ncbi:MAG: subtilisin-like proprotein convertase family protein [Polaribacter sp.]|jgi:subtilisin-like proprotein convertase family protein